MGIIFCLRLIPTRRIHSRDCRTHKNYLPCFLTPSKIHHPIPKIYLCFSSEYGLSQAPDFPRGLALGRWSPATLAHLQSLHLSLRPCPCASSSTPLRCDVPFPHGLAPSFLFILILLDKDHVFSSLDLPTLRSPVQNMRLELPVCVGSVPGPQRTRGFSASVNSIPPLLLLLHIMALLTTGQTLFPVLYTDELITLCSSPQSMADDKWKGAY